MGAPTVNPECYEWLCEGVIDGVIENLRAMSINCSKATIKKYSLAVIDDCIEDNVATAYEFEHEERIEEFDNDKDALLEELRERSIGWHYEEQQEELIKNVVSKIKRAIEKNAKTTKPDSAKRKSTAKPSRAHKRGKKHSKS